MYVLLTAVLATVISPADEHIQYIGRSVTLPSGERLFDNSGFQVRFKVEGTKEVSVRMKARHATPSLPRAGSQFVLNLFDILVDGVRQPARISTAGSEDNTLHVYPIAQGLSPSAHTIEVFKSTEPAWNLPVPAPCYVTFSGIVLSDNASLVPPDPLPERRIEFVGDSITAGYCNLCHSTPEPKDEEAESFYDSWASQICRGAGAACHNIAWSGFGVIRNYSPGNVTLPDVYKETLASDMAGPAWNFSQWKPDAVVVNLGTNDHVKCVGDFCERFVAAYVAMVQGASQAYGTQTQWFLVCGPMSTAHCPQVRNVVARLNSVGVPARFLDLSKFWLSTSCCWHPSASEAVAIGSYVSALLNHQMGWGESVAYPTTGRVPAPSPRWSFVLYAVCVVLLCGMGYLFLLEHYKRSA